MRMKLAGRGVGVGGTKSKQRRQQQQQQLGFSMWTLHESSAKPLSVVPTTAIALLDTYVVTVAKRFPDDAGVQVLRCFRGGQGAGGFVLVCWARGGGQPNGVRFCFRGCVLDEDRRIVYLAQHLASPNPDR